jgi:hypothetical protein
LVGDQAPRGQRLARLVKLGAGHGQALAEGRVGVVTEALSIRHGDQEQIEGAGGMAEPIDIALTDQALIDPAELRGDLPQVRQREGLFVHWAYLLSLGGHSREYRAPIVAGGGRWWRCPLVT